MTPTSTEPKPANRLARVLHGDRRGTRSPNMQRTQQTLSPFSSVSLTDTPTTRTEALPVVGVWISVFRTPGEKPATRHRNGPQPVDCQVSRFKKKIHSDRSPATSFTQDRKKVITILGAPAPCSQLPPNPRTPPPSGVRPLSENSPLSWRPHLTHTQFTTSPVPSVAT